MADAGRLEGHPLNDVTIIIPIFGNVDEWSSLAERAERSALAQTVPADAVVVSVAETLQQARNEPALAAKTEWLCFLDADDELDGRYVEAMLAGTGDIRQPATLGVVDGVEDDQAVLIPSRPLDVSNYVVIGAFVRTDLFRRVGGFDDWAAFEDWDLWRRCVNAGAEIGSAPPAIYRVHVRPHSRNSMMAPGALAAYQAIRRRPFTAVDADDT